MTNAIPTKNRMVQKPKIICESSSTGATVDKGGKVEVTVEIFVTNTFEFVANELTKVVVAILAVSLLATTSAVKFVELFTSSVEDKSELNE